KHLTFSFLVLLGNSTISGFSSVVLLFYFHYQFFTLVLHIHRNKLKLHIFLCIFQILSLITRQAEIAFTISTCPSWALVSKMAKAFTFGVEHGKVKFGAKVMVSAAFALYGNLLLGAGAVGVLSNLGEKMTKENGFLISYLTEDDPDKPMLAKVRRTTRTTRKLFP
ncbi:MAG: hypothetical protein FWC91_02150, partial [Defluviitaleaceae bacterium]|nr:hypothetical protein [Defluviitaleaceae bacterium]